MHDIVNLEVIILAVLNKTGIVGRELQILLDGLLSQTINISDLDQTSIPVPLVDVVPTITIELRDVDGDGQMSAPLVYEFTVVDDTPTPTSDDFKVCIYRIPQGC